MKWFEKLMSSNKGRVAWFIFMIIILFIPTPQGYGFTISIIELFLAWFAVSYLSDKLNLKHKKLWKIMAIILGGLTYIVFLIVKRKQLKSIKQEN